MTVNLWAEPEHARGYLDERKHWTWRDAAYGELEAWVPPAGGRVLLTRDAAACRRALRGRRAGRGSPPRPRRAPFRGVGTFDLVVSAFAIHHVVDARKQTLYREVYSWLRARFAGEDVELVGATGSATERRPQFEIDPDDAVESVLAFYRDEIDHARRITDAAASLDQVATVPSASFGAVSLRWILVHMVEETARHNGHLDLMREEIDGRTGD